MRLLYVEDEDSLRSLTEKRLIEAGYSVDCCADGVEALDFLAVTEYDVVILDLMLSLIHIWFVKEQGEEETTAQDLITRMDLFGSDPKGLYLLDSELAARTYAAPTLTL